MYEKKTHGEWLSLLEISGPFLAETVLESHFPQGLDELNPAKKKLLRQAYEEWREAQDDADPSFSELHAAWIDLVLKQGLELDEDDDEDVLKPANSIDGVSFEAPEHGVVIKPDYAVVTGSDHQPSLLIKTLPAGIDLETVNKSDGWAASPVERMLQLCRATKVRLGLLTNGERWMLIDAPEGGVTTYASWYARLWGQEPVTLQAFINLLGIRRFFLDSSQQLPALLDESLKHQDEVTDALGDQVRRAVEVLVQALDKADQDRERELLKDVEPAELYEAGLTVMMRLVFLLSAEERGLLLLGDERYEAYYAVSSLRMQLREQAGLHSEEILSHRRDAWSRLLAIFRAVYGGVDHETLRMPALGGSLFDPDRFPFLEGRTKDSNWRYDPAQPLPIDNRTVLLLLDAIQLFQGRTLSYRALDVEQIGYVYEGLLERTVVRAKDVTLELEATKKSKKPWVTWGELEDARLSGEKAVKALLVERTGSSTTRINNDLNKVVSDAHKEKLLVVCLGDQALRDRLAPYYHFLRIDPWGYPLIYPKGAFMVATGSDRRETGTHYTPKSLTESIVKGTLEPIVYVGPAEGTERKDWKLKTPEELLDLKICDLAMGSGAFLVQVCRWLSERLLEAWAQAESQNKFITGEGIVVDNISNQEPMTGDAEERSVNARRLISERCLYGVDINPLAVELAKLSIWLVTLAKGRPFGFLDHNLRHGDSLLGITDLEQLYYLDMNVGKGSEKKLFAQKIEEAVKEAIELRLELRKRPILDIHDVEIMAHLDQKAREKLELPDLVADALVGEILKANGGKVDTALLSIVAGKTFEGDFEGSTLLRAQADIGLNTDIQTGKYRRKPFHLCLQFPEVFCGNKGGFDAVVGNPPYMGGRLIGKHFGKAYFNYLDILRNGKKGSPDICVFFILRSFSVVNTTGSIGLITSNSVRDTGNRIVGLDQVVSNGGVIFNAARDFQWPGKANVVVSLIFISKLEWKAAQILDGKEVRYISGGLDPLDNTKVTKLKSMKGINSQGYSIMGEGFILNESERATIVSADPKSEEVIYPYYNGDDLLELEEISPKRWIIDFENRTEAEARHYIACFQRVEELVEPFRSEQKGQIHQSCFWKYWDMRPSLRSFLKESESALALPIVAKYIVFRFVPSNAVYNHKLKIIFDSSFSMFAVLQSSIHDIWARWMSGQLGSTTINYSSSRSLDTFPLPDEKEQKSLLHSAGKDYDNARSESMKGLSVGSTQLYNLVNDASKTHVLVENVRSHIVLMDKSVLQAYGWNDINLSHGFHHVSYLPEGKNTRFTISESAREELLNRLALLNKERHEKEISNKFRSENEASIRRSEKRQSRFSALEIGSTPQMDIFGQEDE
ncbi:Eco57I restriction-modification methylase domain-containing protein [Ketobacter sp.]|uniref:Eco57I restriction-modification methylase domain-containing protein n=1 Tax=Ketobacter sp. TaxID=2083498 RepID=UPI0025C492E2|nr:type IIL restriction-modification enzyme MmeI [Ketobacter sp.]